MAAGRTESASTGTAATADREIVFTRVFDAPRELVWKAWFEDGRASIQQAFKGTFDQLADYLAKAD